MELILAKQLFNIACIIYVIAYFTDIFPENILGCGIFGASAKKGKKINLRKIAALGLYNIQRGTDSCGYYYNGNLEKGVAANSNFGNFISKHKITPGELPGDIFMGHTRKSTHGVSNEENAHPHMINNRYVQTHNGVIKNIWPMLTARKISHVNIDVDSIGLGTVIEQENSFKILSEYEGYAALAMNWIEEPEKLYLYHGASKEFEAGKVVEERPLFTLDTPEALYYSSMPESLDFINENSSIKPEALPHNMVYLIEHGKIQKPVYRAKRESNNITKVYSSTTSSAYSHYPAASKPANSRPPLRALPPTVTINNSADKSEFKSEILRETYPEEKGTQDVYVRFGRFFRGDNILLQGAYNIDRDGMFVKDEELTPAGFRIGGGRSFEKYYFIRGIMMRNEKAYIDAQKDTLNYNVQYNIAFCLSTFSKYPICSIDGEGLSVADNMQPLWYKDQVRVSCEFSPRFTKRKYTIKNGLIAGVKKGKENEEIFDFIVDKKYKSILDDKENPPDAIVSVPVLSDEEENKKVAIQLISNTIAVWLKRPITLDTLELMPEALLLMIDSYVSCLDETLKDNELQTEAYTSQLINDLIVTRSTLENYLKSSDELTYFSQDSIEQCFEKYTADEIMEFENRYKYLTLSYHLNMLDDGYVTPKLNENPRPSDFIEDVEESAFNSNEFKINQLELSLFKSDFKILEEEYRDLLLEDTLASRDKAQFLSNDLIILENKILNKEFELRKQSNNNCSL
jgi:hypothetical protein